MAQRQAPKITLLMSTTTFSSYSPAARGIALVLLAAMLWGTTGTAQSLAPAGLSPFWLGALRLCLAGLFFVLLLPLHGRAARPQPAAWGRLLLCGLCMAVYNLSFFTGVQRSGVALGTALAIGSSPIWAGLLQIVWLRRWPGPLWWLGTAIGVAGGLLMALERSAVTTSWSGHLLCLLAGLSYAVYALANQQLVRSASVASVNAWVFGLAALLSLPFAAWLAGPLQISPGGWAVVVYLGWIATGLAYLLFSTGLRSISVATGVALSKAEPITAFVLAMLVVGERPGWQAVAGLALVLLGLWLVVRSELKRGA